MTSYSSHDDSTAFSWINVTTAAYQDDKQSEQMLHIVHSIAVVSLIISIVVSALTLLYFSRTTDNRAFWEKRMAERLVVYLAVCDLFYSINHLGRCQIVNP